jgi:hypothetical protein
MTDSITNWRVTCAGNTAFKSDQSRDIALKRLTLTLPLSLREREPFS